MPRGIRMPHANSRRVMKSFAGASPRIIRSGYIFYSLPAAAFAANGDLRNRPPLHYPPLRLANIDPLIHTRQGKLRQSVEAAEGFVLFVFLSRNT